MCHLVATKNAEEAAKISEAFKKISRSTLGKCQALWDKQSRSTQASDIIQEILGNQLIIPNATRWNATYNALERIKRITTAGGDLDDVCDRLEVPRFKQAERTFISEYVTVNVIDIAVLKQVYNILSACVVVQENYVRT